MWDATIRSRFRKKSMQARIPREGNEISFSYTVQECYGGIIYNLRGWLVARTRPSLHPLPTSPHSSIVFGSPPRTLCLLCFIPLASTIPYGSVFSISTSLAMQDDTMHPWYKGPCVIHSKLLSIHATKQDHISYWTNNKDNRTRLDARFEHASHNPESPLHPSSPSLKQPITP